MSDLPETTSPGPAVRPARRSRSLLILLTIGLVLVGAAAPYLRLSYSRAVGSGPAGPAVERGVFSQPWTSRPVLLVGFGDSVTAGFGARTGYGYFDRLVRNPAAEFPDVQGVCLTAVLTNLRATNLSVSGSVSVEVLQSQLGHLPAMDSNTLGLVVMTTGGNDLIHNYGRTPPRELAMYGASWNEAQPWINNFAERLEAIVNQISARFPGGCHIFLANIYDPTDGVGDIQKAGLPPWPDGMKILAAYNDVIRRCTDKHPNVHLVNLHDAFLGHGLHCGQVWAKHYDSKDPHYWYYTNLEDPNERGYDAIRRLFLLEIAKLKGQDF